MKVLSEVTYFLPNNDPGFVNTLSTFLEPVSVFEKNQITLLNSNNELLPLTKIVFDKVNIPKVDFKIGEDIEVEIINKTRQTKLSPHNYEYIEISEFVKRLNVYDLKAVDHTGFNMPWFNGIHPEVLELRKKLKDSSLYHTFPEKLKNEAWDFIIPGTKDEILRKREIDYRENRQPKIEIVSFYKSSTPLIQIDIQINRKYELFKKLFPEGIDLPDLKSVWVYIKNNFGIDFCFVLNEYTNSDWSEYFRKSRI